MFKVEDAVIERGLREDVVRIMNCDSANTDRAVEAAQAQISAIMDLKAKGKFDSLSPKLKEVAEARLANPDMNLTQLGEELNPPLKKSGVNNRLKRICELARN